MPWLKSPLAQITGLALAMTVLLPLASFSAMDSELFWFLAAYALPIALVLWITADLKARGRAPPFDLPFLLLVAFPISLFWYCIWTRGGQGLFLALGLVLLTYLPYVSMGVLWLAWAIVLP